MRMLQQIYRLSGALFYPFPRGGSTRPDLPQKSDSDWLQLCDSIGMGQPLGSNGGQGNQNDAPERLGEGPFAQAHEKTCALAEPPGSRKRVLGSFKRRHGKTK